MADRLHVPRDEPFIDLKTGRVTERWQMFIDQIERIVTTLAFSQITGTITLAQLVAHASSHQIGGSDAIKLDDLATPDDNPDLNATTSRHGLLPKLSGNATDLLWGDGTWHP